MPEKSGIDECYISENEIDIKIEIKKFWNLCNCLILNYIHNYTDNQYITSYTL